MKQNNFQKKKIIKCYKIILFSEAIDNGFRISKKPTQKKYTDIEINALKSEHRNRILSEIESTPQFVLVNTENNMVIELFTKNNEVTQANAVFKYSFPVDRIEDTFDIMEVTRGMGLEKFENGKMYRTESVMLMKEGELTKLNSTLNNSKVDNEKFSLSKNDLALFISMTGQKENTIQIKSRLNKMLGNFSEDLVNYKENIKIRKRMN